MLQLGRNLRNQLGRRFRNGIEMLDGYLPKSIPVIRLLAGQHLIHDNAEGIQVASGVGALATDLFRGNIMNGSDRCPAFIPNFIFQGGDPKITDLQSPIPQKEHVLWLDVTMNDAFGMGMSQSAGNLFGKIDRFSPWDRTFSLHILLQRDTFY